MEKRSPEEMANDAKLVEATRAAFKEKDLKRIAAMKRTLKKTGYALLFTIAAASTFSFVDHYFNQKLAEKTAIKIRDQELKELALIDHLREVKQMKIAQEAKRAKEKRDQERIAAEADDKFKHWPNVMIIFADDSYDRGTKFIKKSDKPYIELDIERKSHSGYMVTGELGQLLIKSGIRHQRHSVAFGAGFSKEDIEITVFEKFINW